jgi:hypothetical protein
MITGARPARVFVYLATGVSGESTMKNKFRAAVGAAMVAGLAIACSETPTTPAGSNAATTSDTAAAADGSTLKVTAPTPTSPINDFQTEGQAVTLVASASTGRFVSTSVQYNFELYNAANARVNSVTVSAPTWTIPDTLDMEARYTWRVRATAQGAFGPWSTTASFKAPAGGYIRNQEIFDPLTNGRTVGRLTRDVTFTSDGVRLNGQESVVEYAMPQTLTSGELSAIITNLGNGSEQWKTKVMSMLADDGVNVTDNEFRVTLDKRTSWLNQGSPARFTFCVRSASNASHCPEPNGGPQVWSRNKIYFWKFTWGNNVARLHIRDGGTNGTVILDLAASYVGTWNPAKMLVRLGSVGGRAGSDTNPGTVIRNLWVSRNPRPNFKGDQ